MATIDRASAGPPKQTCSFDSATGYLVVVVEDPLTEKPASACAITLQKADARGLARALGAFCEGRGANEPYAFVQPAADPFVRVCMFHAPSGELAVSLACKGAINLAADATILLRPDGDADDDARVLLDALRLFVGG